MGEAVAGETGRGVTGVYWWACKHFGVLCSSTWIFTLAASARGILGGMYMCVGTFFCVPGLDSFCWTRTYKGAFCCKYRIYESGTTLQLQLSCAMSCAKLPVLLGG